MVQEEGMRLGLAIKVQEGAGVSLKRSLATKDLKAGESSGRLPTLSDWEWQWRTPPPKIGGRLPWRVPPLLRPVCQVLGRIREFCILQDPPAPEGNFQQGGENCFCKTLDDLPLKSAKIAGCIQVFPSRSTRKAMAKTCQ